MSHKQVPIEVDLVAMAQEDDGTSIRDKTKKLESAMHAMTDAHVEIEPRHYFADGIYAREIFIPAGTLFVGKIHRGKHLNIISQGDISVVTENGPARICAPCTIISEPGTKRVGYAHTDTVWTTIHGTDETDLILLEEKLIAKTHDELQSAMDLAALIKEDAPCLG